MQPLSYRNRRLLLVGLTLLFLVVAPLIMGYAAGYRLNDTFSFIETGGLYVHADVPSARVYLDGEFVETSGTFLRNTLIQDLLPEKHYLVSVEKEGYHSWRKELLVLPNLVTEGRVLMLPTRLTWREIAPTSTIETVRSSTVNATSSVPNPEFKAMEELFADSKDQFAVDVATTTVILRGGKRVATTTTITQIVFPDWLSDFASSTDLMRQDMVHERDGMVLWLANGDLHAAWAREKEQPPYIFCEEVCIKEMVIDWDEPILRYEWYPNRSDAVLVLSKRGLYALELDGRSTRNLQPILAEAGLDFRIVDGERIVVYDGTLYRETSW